MTESRPQHLNVENLVRENASLIARHAEENPNTGNRYGRKYKCKDCDKVYDSFQALGGHRASHGNINIKTTYDGSGVETPEPNSETRQHVCRICGKRFAIGQKLGGHMRKHWHEKNVDRKDDGNEERVVTSTEIVANDDDDDDDSTIASNSKGKEIVFEYDLNLTPDENESILLEVRSKDHQQEIYEFL